VYRQDVVSGPERDATTGGPALVQVVDERKRPIAAATWAAEARLALRVIERREEDAPLPDLLASSRRASRRRWRGAGAWPSRATPIASATARAMACQGCSSIATPTRR
jgi:hypothetical protein